MSTPFDFQVYKEKLKKFNSSEKYWNEVYFLERVLKISKSDIILDYGCGTGAVIDYITTQYNIDVIGFDCYNYTDDPKQKVFTDLDTLVASGLYFTKIYFLHSIAHIEDISKVLGRLKLILSKDAEIVIITPNLDFDMYFKSRKEDKTYEPDATVKEHYNCEKLNHLMSSNGFQTLNVGQFGKFVPGEPFNERVFGIFKLIES